MATTNVELIGGVLNSGTTPQIAYTSPEDGAGTRITSFNVFNTDSATRSYTIYVVSNSTTATSTDTIATHQLSPGESESPFEALNVFIPAGGTIQISGSVADTVAFRASGLEFTS